MIRKIYIISKITKLISCWWGARKREPLPLLLLLLPIFLLCACGCRITLLPCVLVGLLGPWGDYSWCSTYSTCMSRDGQK